MIARVTRASVQLIAISQDMSETYSSAAGKGSGRVMTIIGTPGPS